MKLIKSIYGHIMNPEHSLQDRMFRLFVSVALIGYGIAALVGFFTGGTISNFLINVATFFIIMVTTTLAVAKKKVKLATIAIGSIVIFIILPVNFITTGGIQAGASVWFVFGIVYVCLSVYGLARYILFGGAVLVYGACYYINYYYPETIIEITTEAAYADIMISVVGVSLITAIMILFQNYIYLQENEISRAQKKEIEELNAAQNRFFSSMSHEIRTPINTIIGLNEMILRQAVSDEIVEDSKNIQRASKMLLALINDILDMSKIESGDMEVVAVNYDFGAMLSDIVNMIWVRAKDKGLEFHIDVDERIPAILYGDEVRIKQVLINILNNAIKYTKEGSVTLSIHCELHGRDNVNIIYAVEDTGMGIKKESLPHLFDAFKRVDEEKNRYIEGTGLGLSIVKQLVDVMGGTITVNSIYTKGSTFIVNLPQHVVDLRAIGKVDLERGHDSRQREAYVQSFEAPEAMLLIVDDNKMNLMVAEKLLGDTKVKIKTVESAAECLEETLHTKYDLIFMDHLMPEMDGIECLHCIKNQSGHVNIDTPIVALTANAGGEMQALYEREGFDDYLLKPVSGKQLEAMVLRYLPKELVTNVTVEEEQNMGNIVSEHRTKVPIVITTDSTCDLSAELRNLRNIKMMPYHIRTNEGEFLEGVETELKGILSYINQEGKFARSKPASTAEYEHFFAEQLAGARHIIHISMAKNVSQAYDNAREAAISFDNVDVLDCGHLSGGMGLIVLKAAEMASSGKLTAPQIVMAVEELKTKASSSFLLETTDYLAMSGRLSPQLNKLCRAFELYPMLTLKKSKMGASGILFGSRDRRYDDYLNRVLKNQRSIDTTYVFIAHSGLLPAEVKKIEQLVLRRVSFEKVIVSQCSAALALNSGPSAFGVFFLRK